MSRAAPSRPPFGRSAAPSDPASVCVRGGRGRRSMLACSIAAVLVWSAGGVVLAVPASSPPPSKPSPTVGRGSPPVSALHEGPGWSELTPARQTALLPLRAEWPSLDLRNKRKWLELADRFARLTPAEQSRIQARMGEWLRMTPDQRGEARFNFQQAKQLAPTERQARWNAYQALTPEEKHRLAARSAAQASAPNDPLHRTVLRPTRETGVGSTGLAPVPLPRAVGPTLVQSTPGATTTLIDRRPTPPEHQRPGKARLNAGSAAAARRAAPASPGVVDKPVEVTTPIFATPSAAPAVPAQGLVPAPAPTPMPSIGPSVPTPVGPRSDTEPGAPGR